MNELKRIVENIQSVFAESSYPQEFLDAYDQMECLASHSGRETFLVREKATGKTAVAKCYDRSAFPFQPDPDLLSKLEHPGLPRYIRQYRNERMLCVVREYIEGEPLNDYARERQLTEEEIVSICGQLCSVLSVLHSQTPPIIHRDIKPENIIIRPGGAAVLIDFDIARTFKQASGNDTVCFGTRGYAPPEQYGYGQTDARTDIYAFGVLLRWLVTGSDQPNPNVTINPDLQTVIDRCTAFAPEDRYADIGQAERALRRVRGKRRLRPRQVLLGAIALLAALCLGFAAGRFTDWLRPVPSVAFTEPLIERAVRLQLGRERGALSPEDLARVRNIFIFGSEVYADRNAYSRQSVDDHEPGPVRTLDDLALLPSLEEICIARQGYLDVSSIAGMSRLYSVEIKHCRISGIQPIADLTRLKHLCLFDCGLTDVTALENCPWLETLDVGYNNLTDLKQIGSHPSLRSLNIAWLKMNNVDDIAQRMPKLRVLYLQHGAFRDLSGLRPLPDLETVYVLQEQFNEISSLFAGTDVEVRVTEN